MNNLREALHDDQENRYRAILNGIQKRDVVLAQPQVQPDKFEAILNRIVELLSQFRDDENNKAANRVLNLSKVDPDETMELRRGPSGINVEQFIEASPFKRKNKRRQAFANTPQEVKEIRDAFDSPATPIKKEKEHSDDEETPVKQKNILVAKYNIPATMLPQQQEIAEKIIYVITKNQIPVKSGVEYKKLSEYAKKYGANSFGALFTRDTGNNTSGKTLGMIFNQINFSNSESGFVELDEIMTNIYVKHEAELMNIIDLEEKRTKFYNLVKLQKPDILRQRTSHFLNSIIKDRRTINDLNSTPPTPTTPKDVDMIGEGINWAQFTSDVIPPNVVGKKNF